MFEADEVDDMSGKWFLSYRHEYLDVIKREVATMNLTMESDGVPVLRWKIEDTILDSKYGDNTNALVA
jgi:hypothetical protein